MTIRMPMSSAARKGLSAVAAAAEHERVILTSHGRPVAVVSAPEELDEVARAGREAALAVTDAFAHRVAERSERFDLRSVCDRLGIDAERVIDRARERAAGNS